MWRWGEMCMNDKVKQMIYCALFAGIVAIMAQIKIDLVGIIPITMQTLGIYLMAIVLKPRYAFLAALVYVLMGAIGLPVFAGFTGGMGILVGPTGGYIFSFPIVAFVISYCFTIKDNILFKVLAMLIGTAICYTIGTAWFMYSNQSGLWQSLVWCVFPFLIGDAIKITASILFSNRMKQKK